MKNTSGRFVEHEEAINQLLEADNAEPLEFWTTDIGQDYYAIGVYRVGAKVVALQEKESFIIRRPRNAREMYLKHCGMGGFRAEQDSTAEILAEWSNLPERIAALLQTRKEDR